MNDITFTELLPIIAETPVLAFALLVWIEVRAMRKELSQLCESFVRIEERTSRL